MSKIESAKKAATAQNAEALDTADIAQMRQNIGLIITLKDLPGQIAAMQGQMTLMQATQEATQELVKETQQQAKDTHERVVNVNGWVVFIGRWVQIVKKHGLYVHHLTETVQFLRVISRTLQTANLGPNRAIMQEMIAPTVEVAKRIGKETRNALRVSGWNTYRTALATAVGIVLIQTAVLIAARAAGKL